MRLIDADALIEALDSFILDEVTDVHGDTVREILERLTTIEERKTGIWRRAEYGYTCNRCGKTHLLRTAYCPSCGAEMDC